MKGPRLTWRQWVGLTGFAVVFVLTAAALVWRGDILRAGLDPQVPFQTYEPPPAPDYAARDAWALWEARAPGAGDVPVFFVHSTTYDGGAHWNAPIGDRKADAYLRRVVLPNHAGPFARAGPVSAPRYRQASLYTRLTLRDDAREARAFAWRDVEAAFDAWLARHPEGPLVLAGMEQGAELVDRLVKARVATDPALRRRLVAVYLIDAVVAVDDVPPAVPACAARDQAGCLVAFSAVGEDGDGAGRRRLRRALVWDGERLVDLDGRDALCVNPISGVVDGGRTEIRAHGGATNATGLEWEAHPALQGGLITAECRDGLLRHARARGESFRRGGSWADRRKAMPYNLFYGDLERDVQARITAWRGQSDVRPSRQSNSASST
jgi:hypothetical protein